ncbi:MAG: hypothetical protein ACTHPD_16595 [Rhizomicrobium sp.]
MPDGLGNLLAIANLCDDLGRQNIRDEKAAEIGRRQTRNFQPACENCAGKRRDRNGKRQREMAELQIGNGEQSRERYARSDPLRQKAPLHARSTA